MIQDPRVGTATALLDRKSLDTEYPLHKRAEKFLRSSNEAALYPQPGD